MRTQKWNCVFAPDGNWTKMQIGENTWFNRSRPEKMRTMSTINSLWQYAQRHSVERPFPSKFDTTTKITVYKMRPRANRKSDGTAFGQKIQQKKKKRMKNVSSYKREWERFKRKNVTLRWSFPWSWDQDLERDMSCLMRQEKASLNTRYGEFFAEITDNVHSHPSGYNFECRRETAITFTFYHFHRVESRRSRMCGRHFGLEGEIEREKER